jgi:hypothetical protein
MNFMPPPRPYQLAFPFADSPELEPLTPWERLAISRSTYFAHRRLRRVAKAAYELGKRGRPARAPIPALRPFCPTPAEVCELKALARRVERLCPSHRSPEKFHEDKSEIVFELRRVAARVIAMRTRS